MVKPRQPLRHADVICVFRFKEKLEEAAGGCS